MEEVNQSKIALTDLGHKTSQLEQFGKEQNSLILAVEKTITMKIGEVGDEVRVNAQKIRDETRNISKLLLQN